MFKRMSLLDKFCFVTVLSACLYYGIHFLIFIMRRI